MGEAKTGAERNLSAGCAIFIAYVPAKYERRRLTVFHSIQNSARIRQHRRIQVQRKTRFRSLQQLQHKTTFFKRRIRV